MLVYQSRSSTGRSINDELSSQGLSLLLGIIVILGGTNTSLMAQTESTIQSSARPQGLEIVDTVNIAASDRDSYTFQNEALPDILTLVNQELDERSAVDDSLLQLDPSALELANDADVRVYFVGEGAGYHNTLGVNTTGSGVNSGTPEIVFPDASSRNRFLTEATANRRAGRNRQNPLAVGDFVDLGTVEGGTTLDFFLIANGAYGGKNVYSTDMSVNPDGINHVVALAEDDSPYLVIGFEDLYGGGDRDFNDLVFAVDIGSANVAAITATPEPAFILLMLLIGGGVCFRIRKRNASLVS